MIWIYLFLKYIILQTVKNRSIVTKLEIIKDDLVAIHAVEVINNKLTGIYFHAYLKDKSQYIIFLTP